VPADPPANPRELERIARNVVPGAWVIETERPISTLLGSCVAVCLWDPQLKVGGMNHFMLPSYQKSSNHEMDVLLCGDFCMEALINGMLARGARKARVQAKAFGGGAVISSLTGVGIGERNAAFAKEWLAREKIPLLASDFCGTWSRKIIFDPRNGEAFCKRGETTATIAEAEKAYQNTLLTQTAKKSNIELF
jgi:chemotaxis protein CheD